jgi:hypothetical protein
MHAAAVRDGAARAPPVDTGAQVAEWCSTVQRVLCMRMVATGAPAGVLGESHWSLVVATSTAVLVLEAAGWLLQAVYPLGAPASLAEVSVAAAAAGLHVAAPRPFTAGACTISPARVAAPPHPTRLLHTHSTRSCPSHSSPVATAPRSGRSSRWRALCGGVRVGQRGRQPVAWGCARCERLPTCSVGCMKSLHVQALRRRVQRCHGRAHVSALLGTAL